MSNSIALFNSSFQTSVINFAAVVRLFQEFPHGLDYLITHNYVQGVGPGALAGY